MYPEIFNVFKESTQDKQLRNALSKSEKRGKKGKKNKDWQGKSNTIWQGKRRFK